MKYRLALLAAILLLPPVASLAQVIPPVEKRPWYCSLPRAFQTRAMRATCDDWGRRHRVLARSDQNEAREDGPPVGGELLLNDQLGDQPTPVVSVGHAGVTRDVPEGGATFSTAASGEFRLFPDGRYKYAPPAQGLVPPEGLVEIFRYHIRDLDGDISSADLTIQVRDSNLLPVARDDSAQATEGGPLVAGNLLANDELGDDEGEPGARIASAGDAEDDEIPIGQPFTTDAGGVLTLHADGSYSYVPPPLGEVSAGAGETEVFTYKLVDGNGDSSGAKLTISIGNTVVDCTTTPDEIVVVEGGCPVTGNLLANDPPADSPAVVVAARKNPGGSITIGAVGTTVASGLVRIQANGDVEVWLPSGGNVPTQGATQSITYFVRTEEGGFCEGELVIRFQDNPCANNPHDRACLAANTLIRRDAFGVPHILADSMSAALFGLGYAQSEDRIRGIMFLILQARGELALHFGEDFKESDFFSRRFAHFAPDAGLSAVHPEVQDLLHGYAAGINAFIDDHPADLPERWIQSTITASDVLAVGRLALMTRGFNQKGIIAEIQQQCAAGTLTVPLTSSSISPSERDTGSNMWALAPDAESGRGAILMQNPHQPWDISFPGFATALSGRPLAASYECQITVRDTAECGTGGLTFYGSSFPGAGGPVTGFNEHLGWGFTDNNVSYESVYVFNVDPANPDAILYDDVNNDGQLDSHPLTKEPPIVIQIAGSGEETIPDSRTFFESRFGPVICKTPQFAWVLRSPFYRQSGFANQIYRMSLAKNLQEFKAALEINGWPMNNLIYADRDGNVLYRWVAMLPQLPPDHDGTGNVVTTSSSKVWSVLVPPAQMPQLENPVSGYLQNSNDSPRYTSLHPADAVSNAPLLVGHEDDFLSLRSQLGIALLDDLLLRPQPFTLGDVLTAKHSPRWMLAERLRHDLAGLLFTALFSEADPIRRQKLGTSLSILLNWDGSTAIPSQGATLFHHWWRQYLASEPGLALDPDFAQERNFAIWRTTWTSAEPTRTPRGLADGAAAVEAVVAAFDACVALYGSADAAWGDAHRFPLFGLDLPIHGAPGGLGSFRAIEYDEPDAGGRFQATGGDGHVLIVEFRPEGPRARSVLAYGQSEDPTAPYAASQVTRFINGSMKPVLFTEAEILASPGITTYGP